ncbi:MAG TPA: hypothetical protein VNU46_05400, partial [Gemmatimonadaceae bacterium]|nr:hypothetical protein [Gemmatimonadaceae bacterium]
MNDLLNAERISYAALFGIGLLIAVYAMLHGSVRLREDRSAVKAPPAGFNTPVVGGVLVAFGAVGYLTAIYGHVGTISTVLIAAVAG